MRQGPTFCIVGFRRSGPISTAGLKFPPGVHSPSGRWQSRAGAMGRPGQSRVDFAALKPVLEPRSRLRSLDLGAIGEPVVSASTLSPAGATPEAKNPLRSTPGLGWAQAAPPCISASKKHELLSPSRLWGLRALQGAGPEDFLLGAPGGSSARRQQPLGAKGPSRAMGPNMINEEIRFLPTRIGSAT